MARGRPSKKGLIAETALTLFQVLGYQATSIDQVVLEAGVSKPTVYSNYPSKLSLWQEVLRQIIERSEFALSDTLDTLKANDVGFYNGWRAIWLTWIDTPDRLAVYRIHWGESHKFTEQEQVYFEQFESLLSCQLRQWMTLHNIASEHFFVLNAVSKEALLMPAVTHRDGKCEDFVQLIKQLV
ncbi:TetR/AcrR family transcriptional regulator [Marinomonas gallaica]|uniref:TetR/AcrR family transcriptional regulator n=1 Tax=Marinomonas gallaica TaxID=1806667 RepID=UPI003A95985E